jgi:hypothetical protein
MKIITLSLLLNVIFVSCIDFYDEYKYCKDKSELKIANDCKLGHRIVEASRSNCENNLNLFNLHKNLADHFFTFGNKVYHIVNNKLFSTACTSIDRIKIEAASQNNICTRDLFIKFFIDGVQKLGYLTNDGIIVDQSEPVQCIGNLLRYIIKNIMIKQKYNQTRVSRIEKDQRETLNVSFSNLEYNNTLEMPIHSLPFYVTSLLSSTLLIILLVILLIYIVYSRLV